MPTRAGRLCADPFLLIKPMKNQHFWFRNPQKPSKTNEKSTFLLLVPRRWPKKACKTNEKSTFLLLVPTWFHLVSTWSLLGPHQVVVDRLGGVLEASWRVLGRLGGVLGATWVRLGGVFGGLEVPWGSKKACKTNENQHFRFWSHLVPIRSP